MANQPYTITVEATGVTEMLGAAADGLRAVELEQLTSISELVAAEMKRRAPDAFGHLRDSIGFKVVPEALTSEIKPVAEYGDAAETGSKPHWVSVKPGTPLEQWALFRGINPYALQHSIAAKGTKPHPYIEPTYQAMAPVVAAAFAAGIGKYVAEVNHGL